MSLATPREEADANQARASDPTASAWVSANAGTGKTAVLVKRALRLLLAGSRPEAILCLTYTKTAAAEMQNRLLAVLAEWATAPDDKLREALAKLLGRAPEDSERRDAKRLFARALEARGGLKIHTIHGFCERLLQRFPLEAEVTPHFAVLDEQAEARLKREAYEASIARAAQDRDSTLGRALAKAITFTSDDNFRKVAEKVLAERDGLSRMLAYHASVEDWAEAEAAALKHLFGVAEHEEEQLIAELAEVLSDAEIDAALAAFAADGATDTDNKIEAALREARSSQGEARAAALRAVFLKVDGSQRARVCGSALSKAAPDIAGSLETAGARYAALNDRLMHLRVAEASGAVLAFADTIRAEYEQRKRAEAVLDYDDLIAKAQRLLSRTGAASWVLFKIDGGIDHILVDEAQDTNPAQWRIIQTIAEEFFAGSGASDRLRTLFAVGDEKQSIYSFQGADPSRFGDIGRDFQRKAASIAVVWHAVPLNLSFRSTAPILEAVDAVFARPDAQQGLTFSEEASVIQHYAHREGEAGLVELWPLESEIKAEPVEAFEPWKEAADGASSVNRLCRRIAARIRRWLDDGEILPAQGRPIRAGDILILVRRRDPFTAPMIRELKHLKIDVAGADRMVLLDQLAVQDLVALADVLLLPEDDLALAVTLKSPFFNLDDMALYDLAYDRKGSLWAALKTKAKEDQRFAEAERRITAWRARADFLPPYEFFCEILGEDGQLMRKNLLKRLGPGAAEAIDEFLDLALRYDRDAAPSLQGFIDRLRAGDIEIKRDMEQERDEVRIMTVHGAKGLEAPIVFLPDTCMTPRLQNPFIFSLPRRNEPTGEVGHLAWPPAGHSNLDGLAEAKRLAQQAEREEHNRLLYVAMTRARDRLYVCGWEGLRKRETNCWYDLIEAGLAGHLAETKDADGAVVRRMESPQEKPVDAQGASSERPEAEPLPAWARESPASERTRPSLAPSRLTSPQESGLEPPPLGPLAGSRDNRFARGRLVHALLQHLPEVKPENQEAAARAFVAARGVGLLEDLKEDIVAECLAIVRDARFAPLFQPGSLAEVPIVARLGAGENAFDLPGQIDRLVILDDALLILDYKTNRPPPDTPEDVAPAYIDQLAAYRAALGKLFPGRSLRAALLWTDGPKLMEIPEALLDAAESRFMRQGANLDGSEGRT